MNTITRESNLPPCLPGIAVLILLLSAAPPTTAQVLLDTPPDGLQDLPPQAAPAPAPTVRNIPTPPPAKENTVENIINRATKRTPPATPSTAKVLPAPSPQPSRTVTMTTNPSVARLLTSVGMPATATAIVGNDPGQVQTAITRLEASYGLSPDILNLRDQLPPNPEAIIRQLNLRATTARATRFIERTPSVEEIVQALQLP